MQKFFQKRVHRGILLCSGRLLYKHHDGLCDHVPHHHEQNEDIIEQNSSHHMIDMFFHMLFL